MACSRAAIVLVNALLVLPATAGPPALAGSRATSAGPLSAAPGASGPPCPAPAQPVARPPRPSPPPAEPARRAVGGAALATAGLVVPAGAATPPALTATSWLVADLDTGAVLGGCGPHVYGTPASVQKLLLAATVHGQAGPGRMITVTDADLDFEPGSSAVGLLVGGRYPIETLWLGLLLNSGNDAANVLARLGGGAGGLPDGRRDERRGAPAGRVPDARGHPVRAGRPGAVHQRVRPGADRPGLLRPRRLPPVRATERAQMPRQPPDDRAASRSRTRTSCCFSYPGALGGKTGFTDLARHTLRRRGRAQRPAAGGHAARRRGAAAARLAAGGRAARLGLRAPPATPRVGRLVERANPATPAASPAAAAANGTAGASADRRTGGAGSLVLAAASTALLGTLLLLLALAGRRRRARRTVR